MIAVKIRPVRRCMMPQHIALASALAQTPIPPANSHIAAVEPKDPPDSTQAEAVRTRRAIYPQAAMDKNIQGPVQLKIHFDVEGTVTGADLISGDAALADAAIETVKKYWHFKPYFRNGKPVQVNVPMRVGFRPPHPETDSLPDSTQLEPVKKVRAIYPLRAEEKQVQGQVLVNAHINEQGIVEQVEVLNSTDPILTDSSVNAIKQWTFKPYIRDGEATRVTVKIPVDFAFANKVIRDVTPDSTTTNLQAQAEGPQRVRVSAGVGARLLLRKVHPIYPREARAYYIQGTVLLRAVIGSDGLIKELSVISGPKELQAATLGAVQQWTYKPYLLNGNPVEVETQIQANFTLRGF